MSSKKLLSESQIRRFMKLSGQSKLADPFLKRLNEECGDERLEESPMGNKFVGDSSELVMEDDDEEKEELPGEEGGEEMGGAPAPEVGMGDEMPPPEEGGEEMGGEGGEAMVKQLVDAIAGAISGVSGVEVTVDGQAPGGEEGMEGGEMPPVEGGEELPPPEGGEMPPMGGEGEEEKEDEEIPLQEEKELTKSVDQNSKGKNKTDVYAGAKDQKWKPGVEAKTLNTKTGGGATVTDRPSAKGKAPLASKEATGLTALSENKRFVQEVAKRVAARLLAEVKKGKKPAKK